MWQGKGNDLEITKNKSPGDQPRFGNKITPGPRAAVKCVSEDAGKVFHGGLVGIDGQGRPASQVAKPPAIIQPHYVVGVGMGEEDGIEPVYLLAQHLDAEF